MSPVVITIDDAGIRIEDATGEALVSPGYAALDGRELHFGAAARARARLDPRRSFDRYWERLDQQPLTRPAGPAHSHADLAYFQLLGLWGDYAGHAEEAMLAVPAGYDTGQLALVLGIAKACAIPVVGLVAAPVVAAATVAGSRARLLLQAGLHRISAVRVENGALGENRVLERRGLAELNDLWATMIARAFVHDSRFDPLHGAASEQALYDRLPDWLAALQSAASLRLALAFGSRSHHVDVSREAFIQAAEPVYAALAAAAAAAQAGDAQVLVDHRLARLPGLSERLGQASGAPPVMLAADAAAKGTLAHAGAIRSDDQAPAYVTRLSPESTGNEPAANGPMPTHGLSGWQAFALGAGSPPPAFSAEVGTLETRNGRIFLRGAPSGVRINGQAVDGETALAAGDCIEAGGERLRLIVVDSADGPA